MGAMRNATKFLAGNPEWKRPLTRGRHSRWEDNIKMDIRERVGDRRLDSCDLGWGQRRALVYTVTTLRFP
jgi:hypothetical protein